MIERIIENWLINTNEKGYQMPFCQYLLSQHHRIIYISTHGQLEQGKDIISIDKKGKVYAYQLKGGNINLDTWRNIKGEIDDLVTLPINNTRINKDVYFTPILVTNGRIHDTVNNNIIGLNARYRQHGFKQLEVITGTELLAYFLDVHGSFLPEDLDFSVFLNLLQLNGKGNLNKSLYTNFFENFLFSENRSTTKNKRGKISIKRKINSSVLLAQYVLDSYEKNKNYIAVVEGWTILCGYILALSEKYDLDSIKSITSYGIIQDKISSQLHNLFDEFKSRKIFFEGTSIVDGGYFYKARLTIALGWLSAFELCDKTAYNDKVIDYTIYNFIKKYYPESFWYWGESATPYFIMMSLLVEKYGDKELSDLIIYNLIQDIIYKNGIYGEGLPDPYINSNDIISHVYGISDEELKMEYYRLGSYHLESLIDILVRRNQRDLLEHIWKDISFIQKLAVIPRNKWEFFKWRFNSGPHITRFYDIPQSWAKLHRDAKKVDKVLSKIIPYKSPFMYYFLMCYPHRLNKYSIKYIDSNF